MAEEFKWEPLKLDPVTIRPLVAINTDVILKVADYTNTLVLTSLWEADEFAFLVDIEVVDLLNHLLVAAADVSDAIFASGAVKMLSKEFGVHLRQAVQKLNGDMVSHQNLLSDTKTPKAQA